MTSGIQSKGVDLDSIFAPWQSDTSQARATGILVAGADLNGRYAPLVYGTAAAATGIDSESADLNTLFAAINTAKYALGFSGSYSSSFAGRNWLQLTFDTVSSFTVTTNGTFGTPTPPTSGSLTTYGAVTEVLLHVVSTGTSPATLTTITPDTWVPITAGLVIAKYDTVTLAGQQTSAEFTIQLRNNSGPVVSSNDTHFNVYNTNPA